MGLACSLGVDVAAAAAAARAGLSRPQPLPARVVVDPDLGEAEPVIGHPVSFLTKGFSGAARLARLGSLALSNLASSTDPGALVPHETALVLAFGSGYFRNAAEMLEEESPFDATLPPESEAVAEYQAAVREVAVPRMFRAAGLSLPSRIELVFGDQAGLGPALARASRLLEQPGVRRCLVGGIDSYCDPDVLDAVSAVGLLATPQDPVGLAPGEAAALLLVERARPGGVRISALVYREGGAHLLDPDSMRCRLLGQVVDEVLVAAREPGCGMSIGTHNGTTGAAAEWGRALAAVPRWASPRHWFPAVSLGETGAAAPALGVCFGARALGRRHAGGEEVLIWASSPGGAKTALVLTRS